MNALNCALLGHSGEDHPAGVLLASESDVHSARTLPISFSDREGDSLELGEWAITLSSTSTERVWPLN